MYPYGLKEDFIVRLELNSSEIILCTGDTSATYKLSDISLEYDAIFDEPYDTTILLQIEKAPEAGNGDLTYYVFSLEDAVAYLSVTDPSGILNIEK